jgi:hypothetical protein
MVRKAQRRYTLLHACPLAACCSARANLTGASAVLGRRHVFDFAREVLSDDELGDYPQL